MVKRARDYGLIFGDLPTGNYNSITDVKGITVGHATVIKGEPNPKTKQGTVRTGVTILFPTPTICEKPIPAGYFSFNGNGEMTGSAWIEESGLLSTPIGITNTHSVGIVRDTILKYCKQLPSSDDTYMYPVVGETWDGWLNDINGMHVTEEDTFRAIHNAASGFIQEGNVGGGTGMVCFEFKGGIGTSSRVVEINNKTYTLGVLVQANFGKRNHLIIKGRPIGKKITVEEIPGKTTTCTIDSEKSGSIIIIIATDAPLLPSQCKRLAKRATLGLARTGSQGENSSGDIFLAFSTANSIPSKSEAKIYKWEMFHPDDITSLFQATVEATEESIINSLFAAETLTGILGRTIYALPKKRVLEYLKH